MRKTEYRIISNGFWDTLQYKTRKRFLIWTYNVWVNVPKPYYDDVYGRELDLGHNISVCSLTANLEEFIKTYPYIGPYLDIYEKEQKELEDKVRQKQAEIEAKKAKVKYFN